MAGDRKKDQDRVIKRAKYIQEVINNSKSTSKAVEKICKRLYISERTVYRDLQKEV